VGGKGGFLCKIILILIVISKATGLKTSRNKTFIKMIDRRAEKMNEPSIPIQTSRCEWHAYVFAWT
jgi:hypothetical protein